jgi:hypothetical protein
MKLTPLAWIFTLFITPLVAQQKGNAASNTSASSTVPLPAVIDQVRGALSDYQAEAGSSQNLLRLKTADFDFKTVTKVNGTIGFSILIFTFKHSNEKDQTRDLQFHYEIPPPVVTSSYHPVPLRKALVDLIRAASQTMNSPDAPTALGNTKLANVSITVEYAVTSSTSAEGKPIIQFITLDLAGSYSKNEVQSVKLVFQK